jgi:hypothetical protein
VLSFEEAEDKCNITYVRGKSFTVHMHTQGAVFERKSKLYVVEGCAEDSVPDTAVNAMVQENEQLYRNEEVRRAKLAHKFLRKKGYPSMSEAAHLLTEGRPGASVQGTWGTPRVCKGANGQEDSRKSEGRGDIESCA